MKRFLNSSTVLVVTLAALLSLLPSFALAAQGCLAWAERSGGTGMDEGNGISVHTDGTSTVTGSFNGTAIFGPGETGQTTLISAGNTDIFVARYNSDGTLAWAKRAGSAGADDGNGISVHTDGTSMVTGSFNGTAVFGPGETHETTLTSDGINDLFVAKYNSDGTLAWAKRAGGTLTNSGSGISTYTDGTSLVTGYFYGTSIFGLGEGNQTTLISAGINDLFVARYNSDGTLAWAKRAGGTAYDEGNGISVFTDGTSLVTGYFYATAIFGPGEGNETTLTSLATADIFVARYNSNGTLAWAKSAGSVGVDEGNGISVFTDGTSLVTGAFSGTAIFGPGETREMTLISQGETDIFVAKYNSDGTFAWAKRAGGAGVDEGNGISVFTDGTSLVTGAFSGTAIFGPGEAKQTTLTSAGNTDIFAAKYRAGCPEVIAPVSLILLLEKD